MASRLLDNTIALRILHLLITPFVDSDAYKLGIIDASGKNLKHPNTEEERDAYNYLTRLVFNMKKILVKLPGGDSKLKNLVAASFLIKEAYLDELDDLDEDCLVDLINSDIILAEETLLLAKYLMTEEGVIANVTGPLTSTDQPVRKKKAVVARRSTILPGQGVANGEL